MKKEEARVQKPQIVQTCRRIRENFQREEMDRSEKSQVLLERAEKLGLRLELDSGLLIVKRMESGDLERQDVLVAELGKYLEDVRRLVEKRAIGARANDFIGQRIWSADGEGVLASGSCDGALTVTVVKEGLRHPQTLTAKAEGLLIIVDEEQADGTSSPPNEKPTAEKPRRGIFELLRGASSDSKNISGREG